MIKLTNFDLPVTFQQKDTTELGASDKSNYFLMFILPRPSEQILQLNALLDAMNCYVCRLMNRN